MDEPTTQEGSDEVDLSDLEMLASLSLDGPIDISTSGGALTICC